MKEFIRQKPFDRPLGNGRAFHDLLTYPCTAIVVKDEIFEAITILSNEDQRLRSLS